MSFKYNGYEVVRNSVSSQSLELMQIQFDMFIRNYAYEKYGEYKEDVFYSRSDNIAEGKSFSCYAIPCFESLLLHLKPIAERVTGKELIPTYSYARKYYRGADMFKHTDRAACQYSITFALSCNPSPWGIWFTDYTGKNSEVLLNPGDLCVYDGPGVPHWRNEYTGEQQSQVFMHYVDANGIYAEEKYDKRPYIGMFTGTMNDDEKQTELLNIMSRLGRI